MGSIFGRVRTFFCILLAIGALFLAVFSLVASSQNERLKAIQEKLSRTLEMVEKLKEQNRLLEMRILDLRTGNTMAEKILREELGLIKQDEVLYIFDRSDSE